MGFKNSTHVCNKTIKYIEINNNKVKDLYEESETF